MTQAYECEVRYFIDDIDVYEKRLKELGEVEFDYEFTDYYYRLGDNPEEKNLRVREWHHPVRPSYIYLVKNEILKKNGLHFKRSLYPQGKLPLHEGNVRMCKQILDDLGFKPWFVVEKKKGKIWNMGDFWTAVEYIEDVGWTGELEFEGEDADIASKNIKKAMDALGIKEVTYKPVSKIVAEKRGLTL